ncbi:uncharacterized protein LOC142240718 [Haematobia irritans]|uniref:uncharacterized protein LOC142240718 n=1 Tax=Haematobia irritans TaxID=7368 RepID=UPI003F509F37
MLKLLLLSAIFVCYCWPCGYSRYLGKHSLGTKVYNPYGSFGYGNGYAIAPGSYPYQIPNYYPHGTYFDQRRGVLRPFPGGGVPIIVDYHKRCSGNFVGLKPHPEERQYYYVCKPDAVIFGRCQRFQEFNATCGQCVQYTPSEYKPNCTTEGRFPIFSNCHLYYKCDKTMEPQIYACPYNMIFSQEQSKCIPGNKCIPTQIIADSDSIPEYCENKYPPCIQNGIFRSPSDCSLYYKCELKDDEVYYQTRFKCPEETFYDLKTNACLPQEQVPCDCITLADLIYPTTHVHAFDSRRTYPKSHPLLHPSEFDLDSLEESDPLIEKSEEESNEDNSSSSSCEEDDPNCNDSHEEPDDEDREDETVDFDKKEEAMAAMSLTEETTTPTSSSTMAPLSSSPVPSPSALSTSEEKQASADATGSTKSPAFEDKQVLTDEVTPNGQTSPTPEEGKEAADTPKQNSDDQSDDSEEATEVLGSEIAFGDTFVLSDDRELDKEDENLPANENITSSVNTDESPNSTSENPTESSEAGSEGNDAANLANTEVISDSITATETQTDVKTPETNNEVIAVAESSNSPSNDAREDNAEDEESTDQNNVVPVVEEQPNNTDPIITPRIGEEQEEDGLENEEPADSSTSSGTTESGETLNEIFDVATPPENANLALSSTNEKESMQEIVNDEGTVHSVVEDKMEKEDNLSESSNNNVEEDTNEASNGKDITKDVQISAEPSGEEDKSCDEISADEESQFPHTQPIHCSPEMSKVHVNNTHSSENQTQTTNDESAREQRSTVVFGGPIPTPSITENTVPPQINNTTTTPAPSIKTQEKLTSTENEKLEDGAEFSGEFASQNHTKEVHSIEGEFVPLTTDGENLTQESDDSSTKIQSDPAFNDSEDKGNAIAEEGLLTVSGHRFDTKERAEAEKRKEDDEKHADDTLSSGGSSSETHVDKEDENKANEHLKVNENGNGNLNEDDDVVEDSTLSSDATSSEEHIDEEDENKAHENMEEVENTKHDNENDSHNENKEFDKDETSTDKEDLKKSASNNTEDFELDEDPMILSEDIEIPTTVPSELEEDNDEVGSAKIEENDVPQDSTTTVRPNATPNPPVDQPSTTLQIENTMPILENSTSSDPAALNNSSVAVPKIPNNNVNEDNVSVLSDDIVMPSKISEALEESSQTSQNAPEDLGQDPVKLSAINAETSDSQIQTSFDNSSDQAQSKIDDEVDGDDDVSLLSEDLQIGDEHEVNSEKTDDKNEDDLNEKQHNIDDDANNTSNELSQQTLSDSQSLDDPSNEDDEYSEEETKVLAEDIDIPTVAGENDEQILNTTQTEPQQTLNTIQSEDDPQSSTNNSEKISAQAVLPDDEDNSNTMLNAPQSTNPSSYQLPAVEEYVDSTKDLPHNIDVQPETKENQDIDQHDIFSGDPFPTEESKQNPPFTNDEASEQSSSMDNSNQSIDDNEDDETKLLSEDIVLPASSGKQTGEDRDQYSVQSVQNTSSPAEGNNNPQSEKDVSQSDPNGDNEESEVLSGDLSIPPEPSNESQQVDNLPNVEEDQSADEVSNTLLPPNQSLSENQVLDPVEQLAPLAPEPAQQAVSKVPNAEREEMDGAPSGANVNDGDDETEVLSGDLSIPPESSNESDRVDSLPTFVDGSSTDEDSKTIVSTEKLPTENQIIEPREQLGVLQTQPTAQANSLSNEEKDKIDVESASPDAASNDNGDDEANVLSGDINIPPEPTNVTQKGDTVPTYENYNTIDSSYQLPSGIQAIEPIEKLEALEPEHAEQTDPSSSPSQYSENSQSSANSNQQSYTAQTLSPAAENVDYSNRNTNTLPENTYFTRGDITNDSSIDNAESDITPYSSDEADELNVLPYDVNLGPSTASELENMPPITQSYSRLPTTTPTPTPPFNDYSQDILSSSTTPTPNSEFSLHFRNTACSSAGDAENSKIIVNNNAPEKANLFISLDTKKPVINSNSNQIVQPSPCDVEKADMPRLEIFVERPMDVRFVLCPKSCTKEHEHNFDDDNARAVHLKWYPNRSNQTMVMETSNMVKVDGDGDSA